MTFTPPQYVHAEASCKITGPVFLRAIEAAESSIVAKDQRIRVWVQPLYVGFRSFLERKSLFFCVFSVGWVAPGGGGCGGEETHNLRRTGGDSGSIRAFSGEAVQP